MKLLRRLKPGRAKPMEARKIYRDGMTEDIIGPILTSVTGDGHVIESYTLLNGQKRFFATIAGSHWCAHGDTVASAVADALWKDPERRPSAEQLIKEINSDGKDRKITLTEFRLITGACLTGCRTALARAGKDESPMTAYDVRDAVSKEWGNKLLSMLGWNEVRT